MTKTAIILASLAALVACSTGDPASPSSPTPSVVTEQPTPEDPPPSSSSVEPSPDASTDAGADADATVYTQADCIYICEAHHPTGAQLAAQIDACWKAKCDPACTSGMVSNGTLYTPSDDAGACGQPVKTPGQACSDCTVANCCAEWDATFGSEDGKALNECVVACYAKYPK